MSYKPVNAHKLKSCVVLFSLFICFFTFVVLQDSAQTKERNASFFYIDCMGNRTNNYVLGTRTDDGPNQSTSPSRRIHTGEPISPFYALNLPEDSKIRIRFGFMDKNKNKIPNKFVHIGPLKTRLYVNFPCSSGGLCLVMTDEATGTITSKNATAKTRFPGCP